jgi:uncharacterized membrane protein YphA (DoxX/SURF4 family)
MKYFITILRILVGALFIFSGVIKLNDPTGFSYKLDEYFTVFAEDVAAEQDSLTVNWTLNGESDQTTYHLIKEDQQKQLRVNLPTWKKVAVGETDTIFTGSVQVTLDGTPLFKSELIFNDSAEAADFNLIATVSGEQVADVNGRISLGSSEPTLRPLDLSPYIHPDSFLVGFFEWLRSLALFLAIFVCVIEVVLGVALLIGWQKNFTLWMLILMIVFFTFLTWYSHTYNKVTDCGCFGDAIPLTPYESFIKDVILTIAIFILYFGRTHIKPLFRNPFAVKVLTVSTLIATGFAIYCWHYLPVWNFLKFAEGNAIQPMTVCPPDAPQEIRQMVFIYSKDGQNYEFTVEELTEKGISSDPSYQFVDRVDKVIQEGCEPEIHDFIIQDAEKTTDYTESFLTDGKDKLVIVMHKVEESNTSAMEDIRGLTTAWQEKGLDIYAITASGTDAVEAFRHEHQLPFEFYYGDGTNLKSMIRSNPGLLLFSGDTVLQTWPSTALPDAEELMEARK